MQGAYGGLVIIIMYAGNSELPPLLNNFLLLDNSAFLLLDHSNLELL